MSLPGMAPAAPGALDLLDRAVGYTRGCLAKVTPEVLDRPTPCAGWSLLDLLVHMDDSLAALGQAAESSTLTPAPEPEPADAGALLVSIRQRACTLVGQWMPPGEPMVRLGRFDLARETLGGVGALEITLHGWDVATTLGLDRPIPPALAMDLWPLARDHITDADRPGRFALPPGVPPWASPATLLLAHAGRRGGAA
ncbi:maleylpyruvate isomerase N-terminal domain-containing protein [Pedococcus sp. KACC 23699]|uniref:Maleylpyruvate isomerase N-terminal domain-containing protein n=1 Tax=Pedococcus sp. KACC 23699 TaxID=3149228 RepID=A0AAU7JUR4_9MICO